MAIITLTTDFGYQDSYIGEIKGSALGINPKAQLVDLTHAIKPQNVAEAAFVLYLSYQLFPKGTIHVIVVDPGVGSGRKIIAVKTQKHYFIAPDNGILSYVMDTEKKVQIREITNKKFFQRKVSATFHGRDIMSSAAAHLSRENIFTKLGKAIKNPVKLKTSKPSIFQGKIVGKVIHIDHFGNLITNVRKSHLGRKKAKSILIRGKTIKKVLSTYSEVKPGTLLVATGSSEFLEVAVNSGCAQKRLKAKVGDQVKVIF